MEVQIPRGSFEGGRMAHCKCIGTLCQELCKCGRISRDGMWTWVGPRMHVLVGGAHWHHLVNRIEPSMCGGDEAFTLTTCYYCENLCVAVGSLRSSQALGQQQFVYGNFQDSNVRGLAINGIFFL